LYADPSETSRLKALEVAMGLFQLADLLNKSCGWDLAKECIAFALKLQGVSPSDFDADTAE
jgi:hypothetical protein